MREIKFRAWDKEKKCMYLVMSLVDKKQAPFCLCRKSENDKSEAIFTNDLKLMQYTGLRDKNGKEIYEGDVTNYGIVEWNNRLSWDMWGSPHPGFFFKDGAYLTDDGCWDMDFHVGFLKDIEVLGNIWENPELLQEKK